MTMHTRLPLTLALLLCTSLPGAETELSPGTPGQPSAAQGATPIVTSAYQRVLVDNCKTSVPLGSVSMDIKPCVYSKGCYKASFYAKVSPLFFLSEPGVIEINFSEEQLQQLLRGERVDFTGAAIRTNGSRYEVSGVASPDGTEHSWEGKLKVRVKVSRRIELIFNTRYHFPRSES